MEACKIYGAEATEDQDDPFDRLPDDLIVTHIFDRVCEAKPLLKCSMVSKKFSSLIYQIKTVSFKIPLQIPKPEPDLPPSLITFPGKIVHYGILPIPFVQHLSSDLEKTIPSRTKFDPVMVKKVTGFLKKFTRIESLLVELDFSATFHRLNFRKEPVIKWMLDSRSAAFIFLLAPISTVEDRAIYTYEFKSQTLASDSQVAICLCTCMLMRNLLIPSPPESLVHLVIKDSKKSGKVQFGREDLLAMRPGNQEQRKEGKFSLGKLWDELFLEQKPEFSGATIGSFFLGIREKGNDDADDYLKVTEYFQGAQAMYIEAVTEMLKEIRSTF